MIEAEKGKEATAAGRRKKESALDLFSRRASSVAWKGHGGREKPPGNQIERTLSREKKKGPAAPASGGCPAGQEPCDRSSEGKRKEVLRGEGATSRPPQEKPVLGSPKKKRKGSFPKERQPHGKKEDFCLGVQGKRGEPARGRRGGSFSQEGKKDISLTLKLLRQCRRRMGRLMGGESRKSGW